VNRNPFKATVKTITIEYDADAAIGEEMNTPANAARAIIAWNTANQNPPDVESFSVFGLDSRHRLISAETLTRGTGTQAPVDPRRLYRHLLAVGAAGYIVSHNHPSGDLDFSRDDLELTRRLVQSGRIVGVECHDHILTTPNGQWRALRQLQNTIFAL